MATRIECFVPWLHAYEKLLSLKEGGDVILISEAKKALADAYLTYRIHTKDVVDEEGLAERRLVKMDYYSIM